MGVTTVGTLLKINQCKLYFGFITKIITTHKKVHVKVVKVLRQKMVEIVYYLLTLQISSLRKKSRNRRFFFTREIINVIGCYMSNRASMYLRILL